MAENKRPFYQPGNFAGDLSENINSFLKKFERAAIINGWSEKEKTLYIAVYLEKAALTFYENLQDSCKELTWDELEKKLRSEFEPIAQKDMIKLMLEKRKQLPDEPTVTYINEAESLCRRIDMNMPESEMVRNILKGLKPSIARYIGILGNDTLDELKKNVRKYELIEFMITGETTQTPQDIENSIITSKIQQINTDNNILQFNKMQDEIDELKKINEQNINKISLQNQMDEND